MVIDQYAPSSRANSVHLRASRPLTLKQETFAREIVAGASLIDAYRRVYSPHAGDWAYSQAYRTAKLPHVREKIAQLRRVADADALLTRSEKRRILATIALGRYEPLVKIRAIHADNLMTGEYKQSVRVEGEVTLGVILKNLASTTGMLSDDELALLNMASVPAAAPVTLPNYSACAVSEERRSI